jgi:hypothetical protein
MSALIPLTINCLKRSVNAVVCSSKVMITYRPKS